MGHTTYHDFLVHQENMKSLLGADAGTSIVSAPQGVSGAIVQFRPVLKIDLCL